MTKWMLLIARTLNFIMTLTRKQYFMWTGHVMGNTRSAKKKVSIGTSIRMNRSTVPQSKALILKFRPTIWHWHSITIETEIHLRGGRQTSFFTQTVASITRMQWHHMLDFKNFFSNGKPWLAVSRPSYMLSSHLNARKSCRCQDWK